MHLVIHDANLRKVAFVDNSKQTTLNYLQYEWFRSLETGGGTFDVTILKKAIQTDNRFDVTYNRLNERSFISFKAKGRTHLFSVMEVTENEETISCYCESFNLELINEYVNSYKATKAMSFVEYCTSMNLLNFSYLSIGINEVSGKRLILEWEGQDTKLARLLSLANKFGAELDFDTRLNDDSSIKSFYVNVYHENDDAHQGVGRVRNDVRLVYGKDIKSVTRKIEKTNIFNAIKPTGSKGDKAITIGSLSEWSEKNKDGVVEFYQKGDLLYAPVSKQLYPSAFTNNTTNDQWIRKDLSVNSEDPTVIRAEGIKALKRSAYPAITYTVDGFFDGDIGDTVEIFDEGFSPALIIQARIIKQHIFDDDTKNKTVLGNFKALESRISAGIQERLNELIEQAKPYSIKLATDNGVIFKNQIGESLVTPTLYKGGRPLTANVTWRWSLDGAVSTGMTYLVRGSRIIDTVTLTVAAYIGNDEVAVDEISFANVVDGKAGTPGVDGLITHVAWANSADGTVGFDLVSDENKLYRGEYRDRIAEDSTNPTKYKWVRVKGEKGEKGDRGLQGLPGEKGEDGRTQYTHIAYADNATGGGFSQTDYNKAYIGMYQDFNATDSSNPASYRWSPWKGKDGKDGVPGPKGADGRTPYIHFAYSDSADGTGLTVTDNGQRYKGYYSDYTQADSTDKTKYRWSDRWAKIEVGGKNILRNSLFNNAVDRAETFTVAGVTYRNKSLPHWGSLYNSGISNPTTSFHAIFRENFEGVGPVIEFNESDGSRNWKAIDAHIRPSDIKEGNYTFSTDVYATGTGTKIWFGFYYYNKNGVRNFHSGQTTVKVAMVNSWHRISGAIKLNNDIDLSKDIRFYIYAYNFESNSILYLTKPQLEEGTVATPFGEAQADIDERIDSKADQALTQEQLNLLSEQAELIKADLESKASLEAVSEVLEKFQNFQKMTRAEWDKSEKAIIDHLNRIVAVETNLGQMAQKWNAVDSFMQYSEDGLSLGKKDGSASMLISPNGRITIYSNGKPAMYMDGTTVYIENGIFTKSVQIGEFREEPYHLNPSMNVIRWVGKVM